MRRLILLLILLSLFLSACGAAAPATESPVMADTQQLNAEPEVQTGTQATPEPVTETAQPQETATMAATITASPSPTAAPTMTETSLPPLELPTLMASAPALIAWDGLPTYLGDSLPGYYFRVEYDPELWALTTDAFGQPTLGHRKIEYCSITPTEGRGLPPGVRVEHEVLYVGDVTFDVGMAYENGVLTFVTIQGSNGTIFTGFQVDFKEMSDACRQDALAVLSTLKAVSIPQATPQP